MTYTRQRTVYLRRGSTCSFATERPGLRSNTSDVPSRTAAACFPPGSSPSSWTLLFPAVPARRSPTSASFSSRAVREEKKQTFYTRVNRLIIGKSRGWFTDVVFRRHRRALELDAQPRGQTEVRFPNGGFRFLLDELAHVERVHVTQLAGQCQRQRVVQQLLTNVHGQALRVLGDQLPILEVVVDDERSCNKSSTRRSLSFVSVLITDRVDSKPRTSQVKHNSRLETCNVRTDLPRLPGLKSTN